MTTSQRQYNSPETESKAFAALHYAKLGLPVLPMQGMRENGSIKKSTYQDLGGMDSATTNSKIIEKDWERYWRHPGTLIAVRIDWHFIALDIDCHNGQADGRIACPDWASLSPFAYHTVNGGGRALFRYEQDLRHHSFKDETGCGIGIDLLVGRRLCIMPSRLEDWIGEPLTSLSDLPLLPPQWRPPAFEPSSPSSRQDDYESPELRAYRAIYALGCIPNDGTDPDLDNRSEWVRIGLSLYAGVCDVGHGFDYLIDEARAAFIEWSSQWPGDGPRHSSKTLESEASKLFDDCDRNPPREINVGTLFYYANKADPDWRKQFDDWLDWSHDALQRCANCEEDIFEHTITDGDGVVHEMGDGQALPMSARPNDAELLEPTHKESTVDKEQEVAEPEPSDVPPESKGVNASTDPEKGKTKCKRCGKEISLGFGTVFRILCGSCHALEKIEGSAPLADEWPAPLSDAAYIGLPGEFVRLYEPLSEADPAALLMHFLSAFGGLAGDMVYVQIEATEHPPRIWSVIVGSTAGGRKGTAKDQARKLFIDAGWGHELFINGGLSSAEGLIYEVRDGDPLSDAHKPKFDPGVIDKRRIINEAEFSNVLKQGERPGNTLSQFLRSFWEVKRNGVIRSLTKNNRQKTTGPHIVVTGDITKNELLKNLTQTETANGFANRFMFFLVRRSKRRPRGNGIPNLEAVSKLCTAINERLAHIEEISRNGLAVGVINRNGLEVGMTDAAWDLWENEYARLTDERQGLFGEVTARAAPQVRRLALVYALADPEASFKDDAQYFIDKRHLEAALEVWRFAEQSARIIFGESLGDPLADGIYARLKRDPDGMSRWDITNAMGRNSKKVDIDRAAALLLQANLIRVDTIPVLKGRPEERWFAV